MGRARRGDPALKPTREHFWGLLLPIVFAIGSAHSALACAIEPGLLGSHAVLYTEAAAAWVAGGNPWSVGHWPIQFAGPPPMLLPFLPFIGLPHEVTRVAWIALDIVLAAWVFRRLGLPGYWLGFPPLFEAIVLGHPEVAVLALLLGAGVRGRSEGLGRLAPIGGLAAIIKPYAALPLLAERRWRALFVAAAVVALTFPFLPWAMFLQDLPKITATAMSQNAGDSTYGQPLLMAIAIAALAVLGVRRALWLAVPVLWPAAQPLYKTLSVPILTPLIAVLWAIPIPGFTLAGIVAAAFLVVVDRYRPLPPWIRAGIAPVGNPEAPPQGAGRARQAEPSAAVMQGAT